MVTAPWLLLSPELAYKLAPLALRLHGKLASRKTYNWKPFEWRGLRFENPLGISGGVDKNAEHVHDWWTFGVGFLELGTITPKPQAPNPGKIIDRSSQHKAVWNQMGFPNEGVEKFKARMAELKRPYNTPVFINVGKNRDTPNERAHTDYIKGMVELLPFADAFVVNISSPNTKGLRELLNKENLRNFLEPIMKTHKSSGPSPRTPVLLKISPDHTEVELENILAVSLDCEVDGWVLTNTSNSIGQDFGMPTEGGVSGAPLKELSLATLKSVIRKLGADRKGRLLVSSGGMMSEADVFERLELGADLTQVYSALIFKGPQFFRQVARKAEKIYC